MHDYNINNICKFSIRPVFKKAVGYKYKITYIKKKYLVEITGKINFINKIRVKLLFMKNKKYFKLKEKIKVIWRKYHEGN